MEGMSPSVLSLTSPLRWFRAPLGIICPMRQSNDRSPFTPDGWRTVTARIVAEPAEGLVQFVKDVFDATGDYRSDRPAVLTIGDSMVMISDAGARSPMPAFLYVYVADADETYRRALRAGAVSLEEPSDTPY